MVAIFFLVWSACFVAGFNFLGSTVFSVGLSVFAGYGFSGVIQNFFTGYWAMAGLRYYEGMYVRINERVHGKIKQMHALYIVLQRLNDRKTGTVEFIVSHMTMDGTILEHDIEAQNCSDNDRCEGGSSCGMNRSINSRFYVPVEQPIGREPSAATSLRLRSEPIQHVSTIV